MTQEHKERELRVSAQTADGITVGFIEYIAHDASKDDLNEKVDLLVDILTRQRMKVLLAGEKDTLAREEASMTTLRKQLTELEGKASMESQNRSSGKVSSATEAGIQNVRANINQVESQMAARQKGIESLEKLAG